MDLKAKWEVVEEVWADGSECRGCDMYRFMLQWHPYGMGYATEDISYCELLENGNDPDLCPGMPPPRSMS